MSARYLLVDVFARAPLEGNGLVVFPDPVDRHPDHRAGGLFTLLALETWTREGGPMPKLLAYLVHWPGWPPNRSSSVPNG